MHMHFVSATQRLNLFSAAGKRMTLTIRLESKLLDCMINLAKHRPILRFQLLLNYTTFVVFFLFERGVCLWFLPWQNIGRLSHAFEIFGLLFVPVGKRLLFCTIFASPEALPTPYLHLKPIFLGFASSHDST